MPFSGNKSKVNTNKAVVVSFASHTNKKQTTVTLSASIYVPFLVSQIILMLIFVRFILPHHWLMVVC